MEGTRELTSRLLAGNCPPSPACYVNALSWEGRHRRFLRKPWRFDLVDWGRVIGATVLGPPGGDSLFFCVGMSSGLWLTWEGVLWSISRHDRYGYGGTSGGIDVRYRFL